MWILGTPRSGSTWLLSMLTRATDALGINEPLIGDHLGLSLGSSYGLPVPGDPLIVNAMADRPSYFFARHARTVWRPPLRRLLLQRFGLEAWRYKKRTGRRPDLVVVKEPNGSAAAPELLDTLPRSRMLFLVRDGRDVVSSLLDGASDGWITETLGMRATGHEHRRAYLAESARRWVRNVESSQQAFERHPQELRLRVTYESLRAAPRREMRRILSWLGRGDARSKVEHVVQGTDFAEIPEDAKGSGRFLRAATPGLWREELSTEDQELAESVMGPALESLGYA